MYLLNYFFRFIALSKTRQVTLFVASFGLLLSSFSLMALQGVMGGLQQKVTGRSRNVEGTAVISVPTSTSSEKTTELLSFLKEKEQQFLAEFELEGLVMNENYLAPVFLHGLLEKSSTHLPRFWKMEEEESENDFGGQSFIGRDLYYKINLHKSWDKKIQFVTPAYTNSMLGDVPRLLSLHVRRVITTDIPEVDELHLWAPIEKIWNFTHQKKVNRVRLYTPNPIALLAKLKNKFGESFVYETWENRNKTLVWALQLETTVMKSLFVGMIFLISLAIISGIFIFLEKVSLDLASFWVFGLSQQKIYHMLMVFLLGLSFLACFFGVSLGVVFLKMLDLWGGEIMPDIFVDRKLPVLISMPAVSFSFFVPLILSLFFSYISFSFFKKNHHFISTVQALGDA